jgi:hypothetical protein
MPSDIPFRLTKSVLSDLTALCEFLDSLPYKSAYKSEISILKPQFRYLLTQDYYLVRKYVDCIFYMKGWGWRLRKNWFDNINNIKIIK